MITISAMAINVLELIVAIPAPVRPRGVTPRFPYINIQFARILTKLARRVIIMAGFKKLTPSANWR